MKKYSELIAEAKVDMEKHKDLIKAARDQYSGVAPDLPRSGHGHFDAAHDHIADHLYDHFHQSHPHLVGKFHKVAKHALKGYVDDDRKETRSNEAKQNRRWAAAKKVREKPAKEPKKILSYGEKMGYSVPLHKVRKGIGSH